MIGADALFSACLALVGIATGLSWKASNVGRLDALIMKRINQAALPESVDQALAVLRVAGSTLFFVAMLVAAVMVRPAWALSLVAAALLAEAVTMLLKVTSRRPRPFVADPGIAFRLPRQPVDPSFPSADAMRAAFLAGLTLAGRALPWWVVLLAVTAALGVAFGRVRAGAHYPLDVWAGLAIGFGTVLAWTGRL